MKVIPATTRIQRPDSIPSVTHKIDTGCGGLFVTVGFHESKPIEVIIRLGKTGSCTYCQNEALGRVISIGLQCGVPLSEYIHTLKGCQCENPKIGQAHIKSCVDGLAKALESIENESA